MVSISTRCCETACMLSQDKNAGGKTHHGVTLQLFKDRQDECLWVAEILRLC